MMWIICHEKSISTISKYHIDYRAFDQYIDIVPALIQQSVFRLEWKKNGKWCGEGQRGPKNGEPSSFLNYNLLHVLRTHHQGCEFAGRTRMRTGGCISHHGQPCLWGTRKKKKKGENRQKRIGHSYENIPQISPHISHKVLLNFYTILMRFRSFIFDILFMHLILAFNFKKLHIKYQKKSYFVSKKFN